MKKTFEIISKKNIGGSNLTELNATDQLDNGFMSHNDWVAHGARYGFIDKWISRNHPKSVTEFGCGRFALLNWLHKNRSSDTFNYVGIDLRANEKWLEHLKWKKGNVRLIQADITYDALNISQADLVICTEVFEHVPREQQQNLLRTLYESTRHGGTCIFSTPNAGVSRSTAENHIGPEGSRERKYTEKLAMVFKAGFQVINAYGVFIAKTRIPVTFWEDERNTTIFDFLPNSFATVFAAAPFPAESNNALFELAKV